MGTTGDPGKPSDSPSARGRDVVRGAYDTHLHVEPDLIRRIVDDVQLARRFSELGLAGFVLKSHYVPTAERASVVGAVVPGVSVFGSITLNRGVGGLNPVAVEIAAREGARIVWLPTVDAENEAGDTVSLSSKQPVWRTVQNEFASVGLSEGPVKVERGQIERVVAVIARHHLALATGHLDSNEISEVVEMAIRGGVRCVVITHPDYPTQSVPIEQQLSLARRGAILERCFAPIYSGKVAWRQTFDAIWATGIQNNVLSTDLGQPSNPPVEDGLALMADQLMAAGFSDDEVHTMAVVNSRRVVGA